MDAQTAKESAMEIVRQLGGGKFIVMTGARNFVYDSKLSYANVSFKFMGSHTATHVKIVLDGSDLYSVEFFRIRADKINPVKKFEGVYNDMLQDIFTEVTGLYTHL